MKENNHQWMALLQESIFEKLRFPILALLQYSIMLYKMTLGYILGSLKSNIKMGF